MQTNLNEETWELFYNKYLQNDPDFNYLLKQELATGRIEKDSDCEYLSIEDILLKGHPTVMAGMFSCITNYLRNLWTGHPPEWLVTYINQRLFTRVLLQKFIDHLTIELTYTPPVFLNNYQYYVDLQPLTDGLFKPGDRFVEINWDGKNASWISVSIITDVADSFDKIKVRCYLRTRGFSQNKIIALEQIDKTVYDFIKIMEKAEL